MQFEKKNPIIVIALGGHAFMTRGEPTTIEVYEKNAKIICEHLMLIIERGYNVVITHGNGPQVGNILLKNEIARDQVPAMPLDVLVADTEGSLGYILQLALLNELRRRNIKRYVVTFVTQVLVNKNDEAFNKPSKPVGPFLTEEDAKQREKNLDWQIVEDADRGWRRVVPSPKPIKVIQHDSIKKSSGKGHIVIAGGGGGIPIAEGENGDYEGIEAVVDKDLTASLIAQEVEADLLIILTEEPNVYINFRKPNEQALRAVTLDETKTLIEEGHFPPGSMGPKVESIFNYLKNGGKRGLITTPAKLKDALDGKGGTHFIGKI